MSEVDICNLALATIRVYPIGSLSEQTPAAMACARSYPVARDAVLQDFAWNFAEKEATLALAAGETASGWTFVYALPTDYINAVKIYNAASDSTKIEFKIRANTAGTLRRLLTNQEGAILIYTSRIETTTMFNPQFQDAVVARLAIDLAPLRADKDLKLSLQQAYSLLLPPARETNANEGEQMPENDDFFINKR